MQCDYFDSIATEILIKIFIYLPTKDLIAVSQTCTRFSEIANDKTLLKTLNLRSCYGFRWNALLTFLNRPGRREVVQHVHLDNCYWLDWSRDTRFLRACPNLHTLTLLGVPITLTQLLPIFHACKQISHLAMSYSGRRDEQETQSGILSLNSAGSLRSITRLDLTVDTDSQLPPHNFWDTFDNLEELTIVFTAVRGAGAYYYEDTLFSYKPRGIYDNRLPKLRKFVTTDMTSKLLVSTQSPTERKQFADVIFNRNLDRAFLLRWTTRRHMLGDDNGNAVCGPPCAILYRVPHAMEPWPGLQHLALSLQGSCSTTDLTAALITCTGLTSLVLLATEDTEQEGLAAAVSGTLPWLRQLCVLTRPGLSWSTSLEHLALPALTHLSLPGAVSSTQSHDRLVSRENSSETGNSFKRSRVGVTEAEAPDLLPLGRALAACPRLVNLELGVTWEKGDLPPQGYECLGSIRRLQHLTHLSLHNLPIRTGACLLQICRECRSLQSLRLKDLGPSALCCYSKHLGQALQYCSKLQDLRVEQHSLAPCRELLQAASLCPALQRLVLISPTPAYQAFQIKDITDLLRGVGTLVFALFQSAYMTQRDTLTIERLSRKLQRSRPELVVLCEISAEDNKNRRALPLSHLTEMVEAGTWGRLHNAPPAFR